MPVAASRPCAEPGCPNLAAYRSRCTAHKLRGYGAPWRRLRARFLIANPFCFCGAKANEVDHIKPRREGGSDSPDNLQALCKPCHSRKTAKEGPWGRLPRRGR